MVVAGGSGRRFGGAKQFATLEDRPLVEWSVAAARTVAEGVVLVLPRADVVVQGGRRFGADLVVAGADTRAGSVRCGLDAVPSEAEIVVVHDGARPLAGEDLFRSVVAAVTGGAEAAVPALPVSDTVKRAAPDASMPDRAVVAETIPRAGLVTVQTPQAFDAAVLRRAHSTGGEASDDAGLVEALGAIVRLVPGDPRNMKITTAEDLLVAGALVARPAPPGAGRIGQGFDVHPFAAEARPLVLGGVVVSGSGGLAGHSDADVVAHALADAVLGAAGLGDLGTRFPASEPRWAGADSIHLLDEVVLLARQAGHQAVNATCTVVCEQPKLGHLVSSMGDRLSASLGAPVSVGAKRAEGLGALGRAEGIACLAVVLLCEVQR